MANSSAPAAAPAASTAMAAKGCSSVFMVLNGANTSEMNSRQQFQANRLPEPIHSSAMGIQTGIAARVRKRSQAEAAAARAQNASL